MPASSGKKLPVVSWISTESTALQSPGPRTSTAAWESEVTENPTANTLCKAQAIRMLAEMNQELEDKDKVIKKLKLEIADCNLHREGQVTQLLWLDNMVNE